MDMWQVTLQAVDNLVDETSFFCQTRLDAMLTVAEFKKFKPDRIKNDEHMTGTAERNGLTHEWAIDLVPAA